MRSAVGVGAVSTGASRVASTGASTLASATGAVVGKKYRALHPWHRIGPMALSCRSGSASTTLREKGFVDAIGKAAGVTLVDPHRYAGATRATAQEAAENLLAANGDIAGVFCPNESSTFGMMLAMRSRGMLGKIAFIGFDSSAELAESLKNGEINALVLQNPIKMGHLAVQAAADALAGRTVAPRIDTGVAIVTRESMTTPEHAALLFPGKK